MFPWPGSPRDRKCPPPPPVYYVPAPPPPPPVVYAAPPPPVVYEVPVPPVVYEVPAPPPVVYEVPAPVIYKAPPRDDYYEYSPRHHHHHHRGCVDEFRDVSWAVMETAAERGYLDILSFAADTADSGYIEELRDETSGALLHAIYGRQSEAAIFLVFRYYREWNLREGLEKALI
ncbi:hypothetical protein C6341_g12453 [Phytophthora cactorum]|nr:hypothetical protein C6341_g12453 [Phytophthora cactorum]